MVRVRHLIGAALAAALVAPNLAWGDDPTLRVELNAAEPAAARCRLTFLVENRGETPVESLKLDFALFGREGGIERRLIAELGPVRRAKTIVRTFEVENACESVASILVNDVVACAPAGLGDCLDRLALASRIPIRLFK